MLPSPCGNVRQDGGELAAARAVQLPPAVWGPPVEAGPPSCSPRRALPISSDAFYSNSSHGLRCLGEHRDVTSSFCQLFYWKRQKFFL